jgi:hypothetical protein
MKSLLIIVLLVSSFAASAKKLSRRELNGATNVLQLYMDQYIQNMRYLVKSGERSDKDGQLDALEILAVRLNPWTSKRLIDSKILMNVKDESLLVNADITANGLVIGKTPEELTADMVTLKEQVEELALDGSYEVVVSEEKTDQGTHYAFNVIPQGEGLRSINAMEIKAYVPVNYRGQKVTASLVADFNLLSPEVANARKGFSGVFNSVIKKKQPAQSDVDLLKGVVDSVKKFFGVDLGEGELPELPEEDTAEETPAA